MDGLIRPAVPVLVSCVQVSLGVSCFGMTNSPKQCWESQGSSLAVTMSCQYVKQVGGESCASHEPLGKPSLFVFPPLAKLASRNGRFIFCCGEMLMGIFFFAGKKKCVREREIERQGCH